MQTSASIKNISLALLEAQKQIKYATKDANNPYHKSRYATLESVIDAIKTPLNDNGIIFIQTLSQAQDNHYLLITTRLIHAESAEWIEEGSPIPLTKIDAQGFGSAATYGRRYALAAITGLYQADDDGNDASNLDETPKKVITQMPKKEVKVLTQDQINVLEDALLQSKITKEDLCNIAKVTSFNQLESYRFQKILSYIQDNPKIAGE
jgi:hypothetical protein